MDVLAEIDARPQIAQAEMSARLDELAASRAVREEARARRPKDDMHRLPR